MLHRFCFALFAVALSCVVACAQGQKAKEIKINIDQAYGLFEALSNRIESYEKIVKEGDRERVVRVFYQFDPGVRMAIARNIVALRSIIEPYEKARNALIVSLGNGEPIKQGTPAFVKFQAQSVEMAQQEQMVKLIPLSEDELKLKDNPLPGSVLSALMPIIE